MVTSLQGENGKYLSPGWLHLCKERMVSICHQVRKERGEVGPGIPDSRVMRMERGEVGPGIPDSRVVRMERGEVGPGPTLLKALMRTW